MLLEAPHLLDVARRRVVRMDADDRPDVLEPLRELDRLRGADREDARHARVARTRDHVGRIVVERVEMRVRVDHCCRGVTCDAA